MLDDVQLSLIESLGLSEDVALTDFNLAPMGARHDMSMLGLLHRVAMFYAPSALFKLFPHSRCTLHSLGLVRGLFHNLQLDDPVQPGHISLCKRSLFGLVAVFNRLPGETVATSISCFQGSLQRHLKDNLALPGLADIVPSYVLVFRVNSCVLETVL